MLKIACQYMKYYKSQTFAIFASIFLTAVLLSGISTLMYSSRQNDLENSRTMYGDWHYRLTADVNLDAYIRNFAARYSGKKKEQDISLNSAEGRR